MTEAAPGVLFTPPGTGDTSARSAGVPHFFTDVALGRPVGDPPTGELLIRGPNLFDRPVATLDPAEVRRHFETRLARGKVPRYVRFVDELPRTTTGKIRRAELRHLASENVPEGEP